MNYVNDKQNTHYYTEGAGGNLAELFFLNLCFYAEATSVCKIRKRSPSVN